jgi:hypothetical protein
MRRDQKLFKLAKNDRARLHRRGRKPSMLPPESFYTTKTQTGQSTQQYDALRKAYSITSSARARNVESSPQLAAPGLENRLWHHLEVQWQR